MNNKYFAKTLPIAQQILKKQLIPLACLMVVSAFLTIYTENKVQNLTPSEESSRWIIHLSMAIWELAEGMMLFILLSLGVSQTEFLKSKALHPPFSEPYLSSFIAEYLRMMAQIILWALMLLIPGFFRCTQLLFVPYIALFSKNYQKGQVDALELSKQLTKLKFPLILGVFLATTVLQLLIEFAPHILEPLHSLVGRVTLTFLSLLISVWTYSFMFLVFKDTLEGNDGSDL